MVHEKNYLDIGENQRGIDRTLGKGEGMNGIYKNAWSNEECSIRILYAAIKTWRENMGNDKENFDAYVSVIWENLD